MICIWRGSQNSDPHIAQQPAGAPGKRDLESLITQPHVGMGGPGGSGGAGVSKGWKRGSTSGCDRVVKGRNGGRQQCRMTQSLRTYIFGICYSHGIKGLPSPAADLQADGGVRPLIPWEQVQRKCDVCNEFAVQQVDVGN